VEIREAAHDYTKTAFDRIKSRQAPESISIAFNPLKNKTTEI